MPVTVGVNQLSVVHKSSHQGVAVPGFPDVCKTPSPGGPVPIPYPNLVGPGQQQTAGSKAALAGKTLATASTLSRSTGDEAGTKGMVSMNEKMGRTQFLRNQLNSFHGQLWSLPGGNPNQWHKLVDQYVIATAELYKTLSE
jgi:hypothetical protein